MTILTPTVYNPASSAARLNTPSNLVAVVSVTPRGEWFLLFTILNSVPIASKKVGSIRTSILLEEEIKYASFIICFEPFQAFASFSVTLYLKTDNKTSADVQ